MELSDKSIIINAFSFFKAYIFDMVDMGDSLRQQININQGLFPTPKCCGRCRFGAW
jgi:hypothetical protein